MRKIDLSELTRGEVHNLIGHERGLAARRKFNLDAADASGEAILIFVPNDLFTITPSFFQGMLAESVRAAGSREQFLARYRFDASPPVLSQVENGITSTLRRRGSVLAA
jgi:hypothetical protein